MADGGLPGLVSRLSVVLLLLGIVSLKLQAWTSRKAVEENVSSEKFSQKAVKSAWSVKHTNVVEGEAAGQGIPDRVQCKGSPLKNGSIRDMKASEQRLLRDRPCLFSEKETVSFVTMFVVPEVEGVEIKKAARSGKMEKNYLHAVLHAFLESIQVSMPLTTRVTIITNQGKLEGELPENVEWRPTARHFNRSNLMVQRLESYIEVLEDMIEKRKSSSVSLISHVIFSDFDMIVVDDLGCVYKDYPYFDVALTFRNNRRQPINSGVIIVRGALQSLTRAKLLVKEVLKVYHVKFGHAFGLLGDQLALADVVNATLQARKFQDGVSFDALVMATRILFLPCAIYNWTPSEGAGQFHGMPTEVKVLHFKGSRKRLMIHAWSLYKPQKGTTGSPFDRHEEVVLLSQALDDLTYGRKYFNFGRCHLRTVHTS